MQRRHLTLTLAATGLAGFSPLLRAQAWPDKPVKWLLSQPPGSGPDNVARLLADRLAKTWGQAVVIEHTPGGQNTIGAQAAARSRADGLTFYFATTAALVTNPLLFKSLPYDPAKDFVPVAFIARSPFAVLVKAESPSQTIDELIARSKAAPGRLSLGNEGPRTFSGMIARLLNSRSQAGANLVPYASVHRRTRPPGQAAGAGHHGGAPRGGLGQRARAGREAARFRHGGLVCHRRAHRHAGGGGGPGQP